MQNNTPHLSKVISYYHPLLQRYARLLIHDAEIAAIIVKEVMEEQYDLNGLTPSKQLRQVLKADVLNRCYYWKQSQIFNRPPVKVRELNEPGPAA